MNISGVGVLHPMNDLNSVFKTYDKEKGVNLPPKEFNKESKEDNSNAEDKQ